MHWESSCILPLGDLQIVSFHLPISKYMLTSRIGGHNHSICGTLRLSAHVAVAVSTERWTRTSMSRTQQAIMCALCVAIARISLRFTSSSNIERISMSYVGGAQDILGMRQCLQTTRMINISFASGVRCGFGIETPWTFTTIRTIPGVRFVTCCSKMRITDRWYGYILREDGGNMRTDIGP